MNIEAGKKLIEIASKFIGVKEEGGDNKGKWVETFQKTVDGKAQGEAWCAGFTQYCVAEVAKLLKIKPTLFKSEHCLTIWNNTPKEKRLKKPVEGCIVVWGMWVNGKQTASGHMGMVVAPKGTDAFISIEGNTSDGVAVNRNGDGVYKRTRLINSKGQMRVVGFIDPW